MTKAGQYKWAKVLPCKQLKRKLLQGKHIMPSVPGAIKPSLRTTLLMERRQPCRHSTRRGKPISIL